MEEKENDTFYHYCSNETFCSIINNKTIRLSSLSLSNDKMEGKVVSKVFDALANDDHQKVDGFSEYIKELDSRYHALGFCLSEKSDLLSQWRGYAENAAGVSIGFSKAKLEELAQRMGWKTNDGQFAQVEYDPVRQKELLKPVYEKMKKHVSKGALRCPWDSRCSAVEGNARLDAYNGLVAQQFALAPEIFLLKDGGFSEEREWRLVVQLDEIDLSSYGCEYRIRDGKLVPHKDFLIETSTVREVVLGPKSMNGRRMVESFLESNGFGGVNVRRSDIPYC